MSIKNTARLILVVLPLFAVSAAQVPAAATVDRLAWLSGCWASDSGDAGSEEHWMPPSGGMMLGMNRTVRHGRTVAFEFMRIFESEGESMTFQASPSQQSSASFQLLSVGADEVVFENLDHDFPHRIIYRLVEAERLLGRVEGISKGEHRAIDFPMTRKICGD